MEGFCLLPLFSMELCKFLECYYKYAMRHSCFNIFKLEESWVHSESNNILCFESVNISREAFMSWSLTLPDIWTCFSTSKHNSRSSFESSSNIIWKVRVNSIYSVATLYILFLLYANQAWMETLLSHWGICYSKMSLFSILIIVGVLTVYKSLLSTLINVSMILICM